MNSESKLLKKKEEIINNIIIKEHVTKEGQEIVDNIITAIETANLDKIITSITTFIPPLFKRYIMFRNHAKIVKWLEDETTLQTILKKIPTKNITKWISFIPGMPQIDQETKDALINGEQQLRDFFIILHKHFHNIQLKMKQEEEEDEIKIHIIKIEKTQNE